MGIWDVVIVALLLTASGLGWWAALAAVAWSERRAAARPQAPLRRGRLRIFLDNIAALLKTILLSICMALCFGSFLTAVLGVCGLLITVALWLVLTVLLVVRWDYLPPESPIIRLR